MEIIKSCGALGGLRMLFSAARQWHADRFWGFDGFARGEAKGGCNPKIQILSKLRESHAARDIADIAILILILIHAPMPHSLWDVANYVSPYL